MKPKTLKEIVDALKKRGVEVETRPKYAEKPIFRFVPHAEGEDCCMLCGREGAMIVFQGRKAPKDGDLAVGVAQKFVCADMIECSTHTKAKEDARKEVIKQATQKVLDAVNL